jgi:hypothetical protein
MTLNRPSFSRSVGRSSIPSSSVPSPYVRCRFGRLNTFGADGGGCGAQSPWRDFERTDSDEGGREGKGGRGDVAREIEGTAAPEGEGEGNTDESAGRDFIRIDVGIVRRSATGLVEGVDGRVGGTMYSIPCIRLVEFVCDFARDAAVGVS